VENPGSSAPRLLLPSMQAAALACGKQLCGDYEDPDRTAGEPDEEIDQDEPRGREDLHEAAEEEFPAEGV
jgi:hypothetical protein